MDYSTVLPFTAVTESERTLQQKVAGGAFYRVDRQVSYHQVLFENNQNGATDVDPTQEVTLGVDASQADTFSEQTSITGGYERGFGIKDTNKLNIGFAEQLGYATTTDVGMLMTETTTRDLPVGAGCVGALWTSYHRICPVRYDGTHLVADDGLGFDANSSITNTTYPAPAVRP
ncbi:hypothetical protein OG948_37970 (plasmid) [Embleya sp. NBC_00888]|uniref:hypothetical protein n=1 Tax=Embleya sp. NBC_00888 TaxID=2975960 RepID=UPI003866F884|nr:hypothetical protein OG948_37970 [Embleya sp. NBC_00888]